MKFAEAPMDRRFKFKPDYNMAQYKYNEFAVKHQWIKITEDGCVSTVDITAYIKQVPPDTEVELITKCSNCKYYNQDHFGKDYGFYYCKKVKFNYPDGADVEMKEDQEIFSCSKHKIEGK